MKLEQEPQKPKSLQYKNPADLLMNVAYDPNFDESKIYLSEKKGDDSL